MFGSCQPSLDAVWMASRQFFGGKLKLALVVALEQGGAVGVVVLEVDVVRLGLVARVAAVLTHVDLVAPLLVGEVVRLAVYLLTVRLERAALGEGLVAHRALVGPHAWRRKTRR